MDIIPGTHCAEALLSVHVPFDEVVRVLMKELDLTAAEATSAILTVQRHPSTSAHVSSGRRAAHRCGISRLSADRDR